MSKNVFKLSEELISQISAGEVIERPASVVKELVDNAIDAGATEIKVRIVDGGLKLIEVSDNGKGIFKDDLETVFEPHTTSKIKSLEDLNNVMTLGFRGEALSTIKAVSNTTIVSKEKDSDLAYSIDFEKGSEVRKSAGNTGTTVTVSNLFYNTPARLKFMKTNETEYRKVLEVINDFVLANTNIHFIFQNGSKVVLNVPKDSSLQERAKLVIKKEFITRMLPIYSKGSDIEISGLVAHPSDTVEKTSDQYLFVNKRAITDKAVSKAIYQGFARYIPKQNKVPFIMFININPSQVDVNVHPRKEEIKFLNPFRIFSMIEQAVNDSLNQHLKLSQPQSFFMEEPVRTNTAFDHANIKYSQHSGNISEIKFDKKPSEFNINKSIKFSQEALLPFDVESPSFKSIFQIFNKYIVVEFEKELWIVDQHAAAERINFERLLDGFNSKSQDIQQLLVPDEIECSESEASYLKENIEFFKQIGFGINVFNNKFTIDSIPSALVGYDLKEMLSEVFVMPEDQKDLKKKSQNTIELIIATIACHSSIRSGQKLTVQECESIIKQLKECKNPYSCPHGRPAVWKQQLSKIDTHFLRTY